MFRRVACRPGGHRLDFAELENWPWPALTLYQEKVLDSCGSRYVLDYITHRVVYKYVGGGTIYPTDVSGVDMVLWEGEGGHIFKAVI